MSENSVAPIVSFAHQKECEELSWQSHYYALLMEQGTGKTRVVIRSAARLFQKGKINGMLVLAPKSIIRNWAENEIPTHMGMDVMARASRSLKQLKRVVLWQGNTEKFKRELEGIKNGSDLQLHILIMNIDAINTDRGYDAAENFLNTHDAMMVIDESTTIKNWRASRTKIAVKLGMKALYRRIMTGTPVTNSPLDIYSQFDFLKQGCLGSNNFYGFRNTYAVLKKRYVNGRSFDEIVGYQRLEKLQQVLKPISYRKLKTECLDLPEKIYQIRYVDLSKEQKKYYEEIKEEAMAFLESGEVVTAPLVITQILRLRQALCNVTNVGGRNILLSEKNPRIEEVLNILEETKGQKVLIWSCFRSSIKAIRDAIEKEYGKDSVGCIYGDVDGETRQEYVNKFQDMTSDMKYLVMQPRTAGYGLTLTAATVVIYADSDWSLEVRQQSEDRCHRIGQKNNVTYIDIVAAGTIDEKIREALVVKKDLASLVTGDALKSMLKSQ